MNEHSVYLDTSSIVKRYVEEEGSDVADLVYGKAETGDKRIVLSLWNIGEVLGVLDRYRSRNLLDEEALLETMTNFLAESEKMIRLGCMEILPLAVDILAETYSLILKHHAYQADALQIATCKASRCNILLSADNQLLNAASAENIEAFNIERDAEQIRNRLH